MSDPIPRFPSVIVVRSGFDYSIPQRPLFDAATRRRLLAHMDDIDAAQARALVAAQSVWLR